MKVQAQDKQSSDLGSLATLRNTALLLALIALILAVAQAIKHSVGYLDMRVLLLMPEHPQALLQFLAEGIGGSLMFPAIHIAVASCFKSQRTSRTRWKILLGWSLLTVLLSVLNQWG